MEDFNQFYYSGSYPTRNQSRTGNPAPLPSMVFGEYLGNNTTNTNPMPAAGNSLTLNDVFTQNQQLQNQVNNLNNTVANMQNLVTTTYRTVGNIENILHQNRYFTPHRNANRYSPYSRNNTHEVYLERLNRLLNPTRPGYTFGAPRRNPFNNRNIPDEAQPNINPIPQPPPTDTPRAPAPIPEQNEQDTRANRIEALIFRSLVESLNNQLPVNTQVYPNILEVSYSTENVSNDIVNLIRNLNDGETPENIITTHATISNNTEVVVNDPDAVVEPSESGTMDNICVICQEEITGPCILRKITKCGHKFHLECLDKWLENKITCPSCRADIRLNIDEPDTNQNLPQSDLVNIPNNVASNTNNNLNEEI